MNNKKKHIIIVSSISGLIVVGLIVGIFFNGSISVRKETDMAHYNSKILPRVEAIEELYESSWKDNWEYTLAKVSNKNVNEEEIRENMTFIMEDYGELSDALMSLEDKKMSKVDREHLNEYVVNMQNAIIARMTMATQMVKILNNETVDEESDFNEEALKSYMLATLHINQITNSKKSSDQSADISEDKEDESNDDSERKLK